VFSALLDTCVLWPSLQRDYLLSLAVAGIYRPLWSDAILEELEFHECDKLITRHAMDPDEAERRAARLVGQMRSYFTDAVVTGWEHLDGTFGLPDPDDEHVVAAATIGGAGAIVTDNVKHFPADVIGRDIEIVPAREFATSQTALNPPAAARAVKEIAKRSGIHGAVLTPHDVIDTLATRYRLDEVAAAVAAELDGP
jgi:hypothetical protein